MSRTRSSSPSGGPYSKPRADLYTVLLVVALLALIAGTVFLFVEVKDYGSPPYQGAPPVSMMPHQGPHSLAGSAFGTTPGAILG